MIGTACSLLIALYLPRKQSQITWQECEELPLPQTRETYWGNQYGAGALREILIHSDDPDRRAPCRKCGMPSPPRQQAVPLLQLALKDLSDDVRLLAYAALEGIESQINELISLFKKQYENTTQPDKAFDIAQQYWELCYLGIAEGVLKKHYLEQAEHYLKLSNEKEQRASNNLLLGRVLLEQQRPEQAIIYLTAALHGGLRVKQVAPVFGRSCVHHRRLSKSQAVHCLLSRSKR